MKTRFGTAPFGVTDTPPFGRNSYGENLGSNMLVKWMNTALSEWDTFDTTGTECNQLVSDGTGVSSCWSANAADGLIGITSGLVYKVTFNITLSSGAYPILSADSNAVGANAILSQQLTADGLQSYYFTAAATTNFVAFYLENGNAGDMAITGIKIQQLI